MRYFALLETYEKTECLSSWQAGGGLSVSCLSTCKLVVERGKKPRC